jgi:hypothetical protein
MNFIERPLTLPAAVLEPQLEFQAQHIPGTASPTTTLGPDEYKTALNLGAAIGITPNFELAGTFLPIQLSPNAQYGSPTAQATFRFAKQRGFEMGARIKTTFNTVQVETTETNGSQTIITRSPKLDSATIETGFPLLLRFRRAARLDTGLYAAFTVGKEEAAVDSAGRPVIQSRTIVGMKIPADLSVALHHQTYIGAGSGINIEDFNATGSSLSIPLRVFAGFTLGTRRNPVLEINPYFAWDRLITPGQQAAPVSTTPTNGTNNPPASGQSGERVVNNPSATNVPQDTFHSNDWRFGLAFKGFIHFM